MPGPSGLSLRRIVGKAALLAAAATLLAASTARSAEVAIAEVEGTANHVTVEQGGSAMFTLEVRASGWIRCSTSPTRAATASFSSQIHIGADNVARGAGPSAIASFYAEPNGGSLCRVTWAEEPTPIRLRLTVSADRDARLGDVTYWPNPDLFTPSGPGDRLEDQSRTSLRFTVVPGSDTVPPVVSCSGPSGVAGADGWYLSAVTHSCSATDAGSGLADPTDASFALTTTGQGMTWTGERVVADRAGNAATAGRFGPYMVDTEDPSLAVSVPADGETFALGQAIETSLTCSDHTSGVVACEGSSIDTDTVGTKSFNALARDRAGRTTVMSRTYRVVYAFAWAEAPDGSAKAGSAMPLRWTLGGVTDPGSFVGARSAPCGGDASEPAVTQHPATYSKGNDSFHVVIKSDKGWAGTCRTLLVELNDGSMRGFDVSFR